MQDREAERWDVLEEHLDEAAFLYASWERALLDPEYTLIEVADGPERRLLAHLDGLIQPCRRIAVKLLLPALTSDDAGCVFAAAFALAAAEDADFVGPVLEAVAAGDEVQRAALVRALGVVPRVDLPLRLQPLLSRGSVEQAVALEVLAHRRIDPGVTLDPCLDSGDPSLRRAALQIARLFPARLGLQLDEVARRIEDGAEWSAALAMGLVRAERTAWEICETRVREGGPGWETAALAYALSGKDDISPLTAALADGDRRKTALFALGFSGRVAAVEAVLPFLDDARVAKIAGEAFSAVTGLAIEDIYAAPPERWDPEVPDEVEDEGATGPESDLPMPEAFGIALWWDNAKKRFDPRQRWLAGKPWTLEGVVAALESGPMRRREAHELDLAIRSRGLLQLDTTALALWQSRELAQIRAAMPRAAKETYEELLRFRATTPAAPRTYAYPQGAIRRAEPLPPDALAVTGWGSSPVLGAASSRAVPPPTPVSFG